MCLQFCTNFWGRVSCFRSGCRVCSPDQKQQRVEVQSTVWSCSSKVKRIFCVSMWQWVKHGSTTTYLKQKDSQLSGQQLVKAVQSDQTLNSGLASLWHPYFETRMVFCLSTILRKVKPLTATITCHYVVDWAQKKNGLTCKRKKCFSTKAMYRATSPWKRWPNILYILHTSNNHSQIWHLIQNGGL